MRAGVLRYLLWMLPGMGLGLAGYLCLFPWRRRRLRARGLGSGGAREAGVLLLSLYAGGLAGLTLCPNPSWLSAGLLGQWAPYFGGGPLARRMNWIPFSQGDSLFNTLGNVAMFVPFGFFGALLWRGWHWRRALGTGFAVTAFVECWQILTGRCFDIDDILLNALGVLLGFFLWRGLAARAPGLVRPFYARENEET